MATTIFSPSKTHPATDGQQVKSTWLDATEMPSKIEIIVECQQVHLVENPLSIRRTSFGTVDNQANVNAAIDSNGLRTQQQQNIKVPSDANLSRSSVTGISGMTGTAREWKRDKTFDGCPIYSVIIHIYVYLFCLFMSEF